jgi:hypothetical protein
MKLSLQALQVIEERLDACLTSLHAILCLGLRGV